MITYCFRCMCLQKIDVIPRRLYGNGRGRSTMLSFPFDTKSVFSKISPLLVGHTKTIGTVVAFLFAAPIVTTTDDDGYDTLSTIERQWWLEIRFLMYATGRELD